MSEFKVNIGTEEAPAEPQAQEQVSVQGVDPQVETQDNVQVEQPETQTEFNVGDFLTGKLNEVGGVQGQPEQQTPQNVSTQPDPYKWAEETGRSPKDFFELNKDWQNESEDSILNQWYKEREPYLTDADINYLIEEKKDNFDETDNKSVIEKKRELNEAISFLNNKKTELGLGVKSDAPQIEIPTEHKEAFDTLQQQVQLEETQRELRMKNYQHYLNNLSEYHKETNGSLDLDFSTEINGMKKDVSLKFNPSQTGVQQVAEAQADTTKFFAQFGEMKENGEFKLTNPKGLFDAMAMAVSGRDLVKFAYEQGAAAMADSLLKTDLKRPSYEGRNSAPISGGGFTINVEKGTR